MSGFSICTIVKNRAGHLRHLVEGLERQSVAPAELIVVDMGSTPPVAVTAKGFPVRVLRLDMPGLPLARARNLAAHSAGSERLLFLDVDCIPAAGLIAAMGRSLDEADALISADVRYLPPDAVGPDWREDDLLARSVRHPARHFPDHGLRGEENYGLFWSLAFAVHRHRFDAVGGFDARFTGYGAEDTDFAFRMRDAGVPLFMAGGAGAFHQYHPICSPPLQHFRDIIANARRFHEKWGVLPMTGWLNAFAERGLIALGDDAIEVKRPPTQAEVDAARVETSFV
ncbi:MAG: glycosyl transferase [Sphingomonas sp.]|nr:glycosyl transferase [Sphingomonas sp.]